jgi:hypothetical protein
VDRSARHALETFLEQLPADRSVRRVLDRVGPAIYELEPVPRTAILCAHCHYVGLILSVPVKSSLTWRCSSCDTPWILMPPAEVLDLPAPAHPRLNREQRRRLA